MNMKTSIVAQFKEPHGVLGQVAGVIMANRPSNIERNEWTLDLLAVKPTDCLLELGFGPGIAIEKASKVITHGLIVGVDHSMTMMRQATKRNSAAIARNDVKLYCATVESLPTFDQPFDKIFSANVVQFWHDPVAVFKKLRALLVPGGTIASTYMPRHSGATSADGREKAEEIVSQLKCAGYSHIRIEEKHTIPISVVSVLATNDAV